MDDIQSFIGSFTLTVAEAMQRIDGNSSGTLFLVDDANKLYGCITDGDIRRYLLAGGKMTEAAMNAANKNPKVARSDNEAIALYHKRNFVVIPIVDEDYKIIALYTGDEREVKKRKALHHLYNPLY